MTGYDPLTHDHTRPLTSAMVSALETATKSGHLRITDMRTIRAMERRGLVSGVKGWVERPAGRYHRRVHATEREWGTAAWELTDRGRFLASQIANDTRPDSQF